jgi:hypothetical protein
MVMAQLPLVPSMDPSVSIQQTKWKAIIDPVLANPLNTVSFLDNISLVSGINQIPHKLGRIQQGWIITDQTAVSSIYRSQAFNSTYLYLHASAACTVNLSVF